MFDHTNLPTDFPGVPGLFIPFTALTAEDITAITAITRRGPNHDAVAPESPTVRSTTPAPDLPMNNTQTAADGGRGSGGLAAAPGPISWGLSETELLLTCLEHAPNGSIRGLAIRQALNGDGTITRDQIYQLGYPKDQALKGFSRPVESAIRALTASGKLPPAVRPPLLSPYYDYGAAGTATGYRVPPELVRAWKARGAGAAGQTAA